MFAKYGLVRRITQSAVSGGLFRRYCHVRQSHYQDCRCLSSLSIAFSRPSGRSCSAELLPVLIVDASALLFRTRKIQVEEQNTASIYKTVSKLRGRYTRCLSLRRVRVTWKKTGFKRHSGKGIQVSADEHVAVNVKLEVGNVIDSWLSRPSAADSDGDGTVDKCSAWSRATMCRSMDGRRSC